MSVHDTLLAVSGVLGGSGGGGSAVLKTKSVTQNGEYNASSDNADGYSKVTVDVPNTYAAGDEGKVVSNGALVAQTSQTVTANGTYNTTTKNSVTVNVPSSAPTLTTKTITENGTYAASSDSADGYSSVTVNVSGSADPNAVARSILNGTITSYDDDQITSITSYAFYDYSQLTSCKVHSATTVGEKSFYNCRKLQNIALPSLLRNRIGSQAFGSCSLLSVVDFGANCGNINASAIFYGCTILNTIIFRNSSGVVGIANATNIFNNTPFKNGGAGGTVYIPKSLYDHLGDGSSLDYKAATNWSTYDGYGTITWAQIEGSYYETHYGDDTLIPTT